MTMALRCVAFCFDKQQQVRVAKRTLMVIVRWPNLLIIPAQQLMPNQLWPNDCKNTPRLITFPSVYCFDHNFAHTRNRSGRN